MELSNQFLGLFQGGAFTELSMEFVVGSAEIDQKSTVSTTLCYVVHEGNTKLCESQASMPINDYYYMGLGQPLRPSQFPRILAPVMEWGWDGQVCL